MIKQIDSKKEIPTIGDQSFGKIKHHVGRILVDYNMLLKTDLEIVEKIFGSFFPIKAENNLITGIIEYYGYSKKFKEVENGKIPTYAIKIDLVKKEVDFLPIEIYNKEKKKRH